MPVDFLEGKKTVTGAYYAEVLRKLRAKLAEKYPGKLHRGILFHHDNAPVHSSRIVRDVLREFQWELLPHPPYSPDLAPSDFFLFSKLKEHLKGVYFNDTNEASKQQKHGSQNGQQITSKMGQKDGSTAWRSASTLMETTLKSRLIVSINYKITKFCIFFECPSYLDCK